MSASATLPVRRRGVLSLAVASVLALLLVAGPLGTSGADAATEVQCFTFNGHTICWVIASEKQPELGPGPLCLSCPYLAIGFDELILPALSDRLGQKVLPAVQATLRDVAQLQQTRDPSAARQLHADAVANVQTVGEILGAAEGARVGVAGSKLTGGAASALGEALGAAQAGHVEEALKGFAATAAALQR